MRSRLVMGGKASAAWERDGRRRGRYLKDRHLRFLQVFLHPDLIVSDTPPK